MRVSQLLRLMDRDDEICIQCEDLPIDQNVIYEGTVRGVHKDNPINKKRIAGIAALNDKIFALTYQITNK